MEPHQPRRSSKRQKRAAASGDATEEDHPAVSTLRSALSRRFELLAELSVLDATISQARTDIKGAGEDVLEPDSLAVIGEDNASLVANFLDVPSLCCFDRASKKFRAIAKRHWQGHDAASVCQNRSKANTPRARVVMEYRAVRFVDDTCSEQQILRHTVSEEPNEKGYYRPQCRGCQQHYYLDMGVYWRHVESELFLRFAKGDEILLQGFFPPTLTSGRMTVSGIPLALLKWSAANRLGRLEETSERLEHERQGDGSSKEIEALLREFGEKLTISIVHVFKSDASGFDESAHVRSVYFVMAQSGFKPISFSDGVYTCTSSMWMHWRIHDGYKSKKNERESLAVSRRNGDALTLLWDAKMNTFSIRTAKRDRSVWEP